MYSFVWLGLLPTSMSFLMSSECGSTTTTMFSLWTLIVICAINCSTSVSTPLTLTSSTTAISGMLSQECWRSRKGLFSPSFYELLQSSPLFEPSSALYEDGLYSISRSPSLLHRFTIHYSFPTLMYYEKYNWLLYNCTHSSSFYPVNVLSYAQPLFHITYWYPHHWTSPTYFFVLNKLFLYYQTPTESSYSVMLWSLLLLFLFFCSLWSPFRCSSYQKGYFLSIVHTYWNSFTRVLFHLFFLFVVGLVTVHLIPLTMSHSKALFFFFTFLYLCVLVVNNLWSSLFLYPFYKSLPFYLMTLCYVSILLQLYFSFDSTISFYLFLILFVILSVYSIEHTIHHILMSTSTYYTQLPIFYSQ